jgi:tetratricopeptide (TPR) repeat protein
MTTVFCSDCDGRGRVVCAACRGDGLVRAILDVAGGTCLACRGSGWQVCERCNGAGEQEVEAPEVEQPLDDVDLASHCVDTANRMIRTGALSDAIAAYDRAIQIRERLVAEGRVEVEDVLAASFVSKALAVRQGRTPDDAVELFDRALALYEGLIKRGRRDLSVDRAQALAHRAKLIAPTRPDEARRDARIAVTVLENEVKKTGRNDLRALLAWARRNLDSVLES